MTRNFLQEVAVLLSLNDVTYRVEGRVLFDGVSAQIGAGCRLGMVGRNGCGKTTLLRLMVGRVDPDLGSIERARDLRVTLVDQEVSGGPETPRDAVLAMDTERARLLGEAETASVARRSEIESRLDEIDAHAAPARAARLLAGLGLDEAMQHQPLDSLSGGWRMRVALAGALFAEPDLLLLDEPTNHLDLEAATWLETYLKRYPRALLVVSHDRAFLNGVADGILHMNEHRLTFYSGNYDAFARAYAERKAAAEASQARIDARRKKLTGFVTRFRANASKARQAQSRLKALAKLEDAPVFGTAPVPTLAFPEPEQLAPPLLSIRGGAAGYDPGRPILRDLDLRIDPDDRVALLGANGNGKSTFAKLLAGELPPMAGELVPSRKLAVGHFAQHQLETLDPDATAYTHLARLMPNTPPDQVRARLGLFGFTQEKADVVARSLSGGEKARLNLALISNKAPQLLVLDEPTNHLDIETREALVEALNAYQGAVVLITHDTHLVELVAERLWIVANGTVSPFDGDLTDYRRRLVSNRGKREGGRKETAETSRKDARRAAAAERARLAPLRRAVERAEAAVLGAQSETQRIEAEMAAVATAADAGLALADLGKEPSAARKALDTAESEWLAAETALDQAMKDPSGGAP